MNPTETAPAEIREGTNDPSPIARVIALDWYDGPTDGVLQIGNDGPGYRFALLDVRQSADEADVRAFTAACHHAARATGGTVTSVIPAGPTPNFHTIEISRTHQPGRRHPEAPPLSACRLTSGLRVFSSNSKFPNAIGRHRRA